jgi:hypothetical protein
MPLVRGPARGEPSPTCRACADPEEARAAGRYPWIALLVSTWRWQTTGRARWLLRVIAIRLAAIAAYRSLREFEILAQ